MKLLTRALKKRFLQVGSQEDVYDPLVIAKFFNPAGAGYWYATEYIPAERTFFGYVSIFGDHNDEWGYWRLKDLTSYSGAFGLGVERDRWFEEQPISLVIPKALLGSPCVQSRCLFRATRRGFCDEHKELEAS